MKPHIEKIVLKSGTAHRVIWYENGKRCTKYFGPQFPAKQVKVFAGERALEIARAKAGLPYKTYGDVSYRLADVRIIYTEERGALVLVWRQVRALDLLVEFLSPNFPLNQITHKAINDFRDWLFIQRRGKRRDLEKVKRGVNRELHNLRIVFNWLYKNEYLQVRIFDRVEFFSAEKFSPDVLSQTEYQAFYECLPDDRYRFCADFLLYTGMRRSEALAVQVQHINFDQGFITVFGHKTKTVRLVLIHPELKSILENWIELNKLAGDSFIIPFRSPDTLTNAFRIALNQAGLGHKKSCVHILRHTFGHRIISDNPVDSQRRIAQELLGHSDSRMTDHYTQIAIKSLEDKFRQVKFK